MINFASKTKGSTYHIKRNGDDCTVEQCPCKGIISASSIFTASEQNDVSAFSKRVSDDPSVVHKRDPFGYT